MKKIYILFIFCFVANIILAQQTKDAVRSPQRNNLIQSYQKYNESIPTEKLYLHSDRTLYKPGEIIWFKTYLTDAQNISSKKSPIIYVEFINPKGNVERKLSLSKKNDIFNGEFQIPPQAPGGIYKIRAYTTWMKNFGNNSFFEKEITIQGVVLPKLLMKLDFEKEAYGSGDNVVAELDLRNLDDTPLLLKEFTSTISIGGKKIKDVNSKTDKNGHAKISFSLPENLETNDGLINVKINYEGSTESISRSIPIVLKNIDIQFFAEGGDLIYSTQNKVAFKALNEFGEAADISGVIVNSSGKKISSFESFHQGMGALEFTPKKGENYSIKITKPQGITSTYQLPKILDNAIGFRVLEQSKNKLQLDIYSPLSQQVHLVGYIGGQLKKIIPIQVEEGNNKINISTDELPVGILQLTVFDQKLNAHAERLIFVNKDRKINVELKTDKEKYLPRENVNLNIKVTDEKGHGIAGDFSLAVVDDQIHTFADDKQNNILSYLLMSSELKGKIEEPNFYFDPKEEKADKAIDFVMLTHGWRRFEWRDVLEFNEEEIAKIILYPADELSTGGQLIVDGKPVPNARIWTKDHKHFSKTDKNGYFYFSNVSLPITVEARHRGLKAQNTLYYYTTKIKSQKNNNANSGSYANGIYKSRLIDSNGEPLIGATIVVKGTNRGVVSDINGEYEIAVQPQETLVISYLGYKPQEIVIHPKKINKKDIQLLAKNENVDLDDVLAEVAEVEVEEDEVKVEALGEVVDMINKEEFDNIIENQVQGLEVIEEKERKAFKVAEKKRKKAEEKALMREANAAEVADLKEVAVDRRAGDMMLEEEAVELNAVVVAAAPGVKRDQAMGASVTKVDASQIHGNGAAGYYFDTPTGFSTPNLYIQNIARASVRFHNARQFYAPRYNKQSMKYANGTDQRKTLFWSPNIKTNDKGEAQIVYSNADLVSTYRIILEGISNQGQVIRNESTYSTQKAVAFDAKFPVAATHGDTLMLPIKVKNNTNEAITGNITASLYGLQIVGNQANRTVNIPAGETHIEFFKVAIGRNINKGKHNMIFSFQHPKGTETIRQVIDINPKGFPRAVALSSKELQRTFNFEINDVMDNSLEGQINIYPNIMEELVSGTESILRQPHGCFEQTSSSNYPNVMVLQYMKEQGEIDPNIERKAKQFLKTGYARLSGYECSKGGFEWWGKDPGHETLTAYGLLQFTDMKKVYPGVDNAMLDRTVKWLLDKRDGKGGFTQRGGGLDRFTGSSYDIGNAYIAYALTEAGYTDIEKEVNHATQKALESKDAYMLALCAVSNFNLDKKAVANQCLDVIATQFTKEGDKLQVKETVTRSYGANRLTETAALYAVGLMRNTKDKLNSTELEKAIMFLASKRGGYGGFGSTQSTILTLKAFTAYAKFMGKTENSGKVQVYANGTKVYELKYNKGHKGRMTVDLKPYLKNGKNTITVTFDETDTALPYSGNLSWVSLTPDTSPDCRVDLKTSIATEHTKVGETVRLTATIKNKIDEDVPTPIALIGIPAGLSLQPWQLKELTDKEIIDYYEIKGNYLIAYFTEIEKGKSRTVNLDLKADIPGTYLAPASTAYLYYDKQDKDWESGHSISISN